MKTVLVLSIREPHAHNILRGTKTVELRRMRPRVQKGDIVLIYAPRPIMALVGGFIVKHVIVAQPENLWRLVGNVSGITRRQFVQYYSGASEGFGICIDRAWRLRTPVPLVTLKRSWIHFSPPQCFRYLRPDEVRMAKSPSLDLFPFEMLDGGNQLLRTMPRATAKFKSKQMMIRNHCEGKTGSRLKRTLTLDKHGRLVSRFPLSVPYNQFM